MNEPSQPVDPKARATDDQAVITTTIVAYHDAGKVYLERIHVLSNEGAGIRTDHFPPFGRVINMVLKLSTSDVPVQCDGVVVAHLPLAPPLVPDGDKTGEKAGEQAGQPPPDTTRGLLGTAAIGSSTNVFLMSEYEDVKLRPPGAPAELRGISVRFVNLSPETAERIRFHVQTSLDFSAMLEEEKQA